MRARLYRAGVVTAAAVAVAAGTGAAAQARAQGPALAATPAPPSADSTAFISHIAWTSSAPVRGVTLLSGKYTDAAAHPYWTITIQAPARSPFDGSSEEAEAGTPAWAQSTEAALTADGFTPSAADLPWPAYAGDPHGVMGVRVRVGQFATQAAATPVASELTADGFAPEVEWTGFDPTPAPDAELVHVAVIDPRQFSGRVFASHGTAIASRTTAPAESAALGSAVATNGGYFTIDAPEATYVGGVDTGLSVQNGVVESLANGDRAAVVFGSQNRVSIENVTSSARLQAAGGATARVLGVNRLPGVSEDCGVAGFTPTAEPRQNTVCTGPDDLVVFTPQFGAPLPPAPASEPALQVIVDAGGRVVSAGAPGGSLSAGDWAVQAIGTDEAWLAAHAKTGTRLSVSERLRTPSGQPLRLSAATTVTSAGPILLAGGRTAIDAAAEGVFDPRDLNDYTFSADKHARTMIGVGRQGRILLATVDGIPGVSEGMTLTEEAAFMRSLGAVDAMNLDGGGSTQFASFGQVLDDPSSSPLRPVGDTVEVVPAK
ncbi:MAG: phosphodiester glycosidase family protein [Actinobacteria bacterium]|nr:phosphodiester glycosidase family protein [Actinomycetota bacterium]